ncbi:reverse transcriptase domain-containing protein [Artemisia annua]|uniref:Reverse transcriptase domain-containing protein n=1 Tax=Artemisia annua TaxID=35608 RepID=A0A2U1LGT9_ARTAN|nr:reverse transcriptase domain-containing protein [Artemisia annua]
MSARGRDHRRPQRRNTAAGTSGHADRDPRDVEIERLRERIRELEINPFNRIRTEIPEFDGKLHPDDFLDWLQTVERIFDLRDIPDNVKVKLVAIKLKKYASLWWENIQQQRYRNGKHKISSWDKMQRLLRAKFLPLTFKQDAYLDYQNLRQGSLSVEDLITEFERMRLRCGAEEDEEQVIARFLGVLRPDIADAVSLTQYYSFSDVCRLALRVEQQNTRKNKSAGRFQPSTRTSTQPQFAHKPGPSKTETPTVTSTPLDTSGPLRCFKCQGLGHLKRDCPNKQLVAFVDDVEPKYDTENEDASVTLYPDQGEALIIRRDGLHVTLAPLNPKDATPEVAPMTKDEIVGLARQSPPGPILGLVVLEENTPITDVPHEGSLTRIILVHHNVTKGF